MYLLRTPTPALGVVLLTAALLVAGCASAAPSARPSPSSPASPAGGWAQQGPTDVLPIPVSSELAVGHNRLLMNLVDQDNEPLAAPDREVVLRFYDLSASEDEPAFSVTADYLPTIPSLPGLYRAQVEFERAGEWGIQAEATEADGSVRIGRSQFSVRDEFSTPAIGEQAPASQTPTADSAAELAQLSTDDDPNPAFYDTSVAEALDAGEPFVLVFSTPAFCRTATCGPTLDIVKSVAPEFEDEVTFIHVEPYRLEMTDSGLQPVLENGQLVPVESVLEWGILTEPYVFVVNADGEVAAKLEGIASAEELCAALDEVAR